MELCKESEIIIIDRVGSRGWKHIVNAANQIILPILSLNYFFVNGTFKSGIHH